MKKKLCCIVVAVLLVLSVASVGLAAPTVITTTPEIPAGYDLQIVGEYGEGDAQYEAFAEELEKTGKVNECVYKVFELSVYNMSSGQYEDFGSGSTYTFTLPNDSGYSNCYVLHQSAGSGGIENVGTPENITTDTGFGLFAIVEVSETPFSAQEISCTGLPAGDKLYQYASYGEGTPQWDAFAEYMSANGISGTLDHVWELGVWNVDSKSWVPNSELGGVTCTITTEGGYTVLHNSSLSGGIENLGSSDSFTTTTGFGQFAFIKSAAEPVPSAEASTPADNTTKSPKTTDNTNDPIGWIFLAVGLTTALTIVIRKTRKAEK